MINQFPSHSAWVDYFGEGLLESADDRLGTVLL